MKHAIKILAAFAIAASMITFYSCNKDDDEGPSTFTLASLSSGSTDLNGATSAEGVPTDGAITATFNTDVDASTATTSNITLKRGFDNKATDITVTSSGKTVTITPVSPLSGGATYILNIGALQSTNKVAFTPIERSFKTAGSFVPDDQIAYWNFDDNSNDQVGDFDGTATDVTFSDARNAAFGKAASFNGTTSIIDVPNGGDLLGSDRTLSFWVKYDTTNHLNAGGGQKGFFTMGVGGFYGFQIETQGRAHEFKIAGAYTNGTDTVTNDMVFNADGKTSTNAGDSQMDAATTTDDDMGPTGVRSALAQQWANIIFTFNGSTGVRSIYLNGDLVMQQNLRNLTTSASVTDPGLKKLGAATSQVLIPSKVAVGEPDGYDDHWAFGWWVGKASTQFPSWGADCCQYGNPNNNHFKGMLDDVRIFDRAITEEEVQLMYESEKP
jgi:hypothetical protein